MILEHVPCDLCGSDKYKIQYLKPDNWLRKNIYQFSVVECLDCGLTYVNPRPTIESMAEFYPSGYHDGRGEQNFIKRYDLQSRYLPTLTGKKVLDIGCARGDFLSYLLKTKGNFEAHGVDAFSNSVHDGKIMFTPGLFTKGLYSNGYFDLIMSWAVFEHLHQPSTYFTEASRVLKPGGEMIILVTNAKSIYGKYAYLEDIPRHTYHYSNNTLKKYGDKAGLTLANVTFGDEIFDGRGSGAAAFFLAKLAGFTWEKHMLGKTRFLTNLMKKIGSCFDFIIFSTHWEAKLKINGIMVARYVKKP